MTTTRTIHVSLAPTEYSGSLEDFTAFVYKEDGVITRTVKFPNMNKEEAKTYFQEGLKMILKYDTAVGQCVGCAIMGALTDTFEDWMEEFEDEAYGA